MIKDVLTMTAVAVCMQNKSHSAVALKHAVVQLETHMLTRIVCVTFS